MKTKVPPNHSSAAVSDWDAATRVPVRASRSTAFIRLTAVAIEQAGNAVLDETSGALWIEVHYPDWGGDAPPCELELLH
jgi:hypothetical protein